MSSRTSPPRDAVQAPETQVRPVLSHPPAKAGHAARNRAHDSRWLALGTAGRAVFPRRRASFGRDRGRRKSGIALPRSAFGSLGNAPPALPPPPAPAPVAAPLAVAFEQVKGQPLRRLGTNPGSRRKAVISASIGFGRLTTMADPAACRGSTQPPMPAHRSARGPKRAHARAHHSPPPR